MRGESELVEERMKQKVRGESEVLQEVLDMQEGLAFEGEDWDRER